MWECLNRECLGSRALAAYGGGLLRMNQDEPINSTDDGDANHEEIKPCPAQPSPCDSYEVGPS